MSSPHPGGDRGVLAWRRIQAGLDSPSHTYIYKVATSVWEDSPDQNPEEPVTLLEREAAPRSQRYLELLAKQEIPTKGPQASPKDSRSAIVRDFCPPTTSRPRSGRKAHDVDRPRGESSRSQKRFEPAYRFTSPPIDLRPRRGPALSRTAPAIGGCYQDDVSASTRSTKYP